MSDDDNMLIQDINGAILAGGKKNIFDDHQGHADSLMISSTKSRPFFYTYFELLGIHMAVYVILFFIAVRRYEVK